MRTVITALLLTSTAFHAIADTPQITRGIRTMMIPGAIYDEIIKTNPRKTWAFFVPKQLEVLDPKMTATPEGQPLASTQELIDFVEKLPSSIKEQGLWITIMGAQHETQFDFDRLSELKNWAGQRNASLYICKPAKTEGISPLATWSCEITSSRNEANRIICDPEKDPSPTGSPVWKCSASQPQVAAPNPPLQRDASPQSVSRP